MEIFTCGWPSGSGSTNGNSIDAQERQIVELGAGISVQALGELALQNGQAGVHKTARISPNSRGSFSHSIPPSTDPYSSPLTLYV